MNVDQLAPEVLNLPVRDRALLAACLWESLEDPYAVLATQDEDEALTLAEQRDAEIESGLVAPLSHSDLMNQLRR